MYAMYVDVVVKRKMKQQHKIRTRISRTRCLTNAITIVKGHHHFGHVLGGIGKWTGFPHNLDGPLDYLLLHHDRVATPCILQRLAPSKELVMPNGKKPMPIC